MTKTAILTLTIISGCGTSRAAHQAEPPVAHIQIEGGEEAFVDLLSGISSRDIVGRDLFGTLHPGQTPDQAVMSLGHPAETRHEGDFTLVVYEFDRHRVAIASRLLAPSPGGRRTLVHDLWAFPPVGFVDTLPRAIRELIRNERGLRRVVLVSDAPGDWRIRVIVRQGQVEYVAASPGSH